MDAVRSIMDKHIAYLKFIRTASQAVASIMKERKELIQVTNNKIPLYDIYSLMLSLLHYRK